MAGWAGERLKELVRAGCSAGGVAVTEVSAVSGDANIWIVRGKKRCGFELEVSFKWSADVSSSGTSKTIAGSGKLVNASSDDLDDARLEGVEVSPAKQADAAAHEAEALKRVKDHAAGLLRPKLEQLLEELKAK